jgi:hypothetical protein
MKMKIRIDISDEIEENQIKEIIKSYNLNLIRKIENKDLQFPEMEIEGSKENLLRFLSKEYSGIIDIELGDDDINLYKIDEE